MLETLPFVRGRANLGEIESNRVESPQAHQSRQSILGCGPFFDAIPRPRPTKHHAWNVSLNVGRLLVAMVFFISVTFALLLTGLVLAPWYADQTLSFLSGKGFDPPTVILLLASIVIIALLVSGLGERRPWLRWNALITFLVVATWIGSVIYAFTAVEPDTRRYGPGLIFGISSLWVPFFAWSLFLPLSWLGRFAILLSLLILQPLFVVRYKVQQTNDLGDMIVLKRSTPYMAAHAKGSKQSSAQADNKPAGEASPSSIAPVKKNTLASALSDWTLAKNAGTDGRLVPGLAPESLMVETANSGDEPWKLQLIRPQFAFTQGEDLTVSFRARSPKPRKIHVEVSQNHEPWKRLGVDAVIELKPEWQNFTYKSKVGEAEPDARLVFDVGGNNTSVEIADIEVSPLPRNSAPKAPVAPSPVASTEPAKQSAAADRKEPKAPVNAKPLTTNATSGSAAKSTAPHPAAAGSSKPAVLNEGWSIVVTNPTDPVEMTPVMNGEAYWSIKVPADDSKATESIKFENAGLTLQKDKRYEVRFRARANAPRSVTVSVTQLSDPWSTMRLSQRFELKTEWQDLTGRFEASEAGPSRIQINLDGPLATIDISQIQLIAVD